MSEFGSAYRVRVFGSSHGPYVGVEIDGLPLGFQPDLAELRHFMDRRAPGKSPLTSARSEADLPVFSAGLENGVVTGTVRAEIANTDVRKQDYAALRSVPRPGHADYPAMVKYGADYESGGGAFSGRMTAPLCIAGGLALQLLARNGIAISAEAEQIGGERRKTEFERVISEAKAAGDSVGGVIACTVTGLPVGLGGALWDGLETAVSAAVFGIPAVKGVEFGEGFHAAELRGSENNDEYCMEQGRVTLRTNHAGGVLGGMADGMPLEFRVAIKPTPSIAGPQNSVNLASGENAVLHITGRHDPCIVLRALPCVEAAAACAVLDLMLAEEKAGDLAALRRQIDRADRALISAFDARMAAAAKIGAWKQAQGVAVLDAERERQKLDSAAAQSAYPDAVRTLFETLMRLSREEQEKQ